MSIVQCIVKGVGGEVTIEPPSRCSNALFTVYDSTGAVICNNSAATISNANALTTNAATRRGRSLLLSSTTGVVAGDRLKVEGPDEWVRVKKVDGNTVSLWSPLREDHSNSSAVYSTKVTANIPASNASSLFYDGRVRWELDGRVYWSGVECTNYPLQRIANEQDIYAVHPHFFSLLSNEDDPGAALDAAHEHVLMMLSTKGRARVYPASTEFVNATALAFARNHFRSQPSESAQKMFERYSQELDNEILKLENSIGADVDEDGDISEDEQRSSMCFRVIR